MNTYELAQYPMVSELKTRILDKGTFVITASLPGTWSPLLPNVAAWT